ncbi:MAG: substrate-binding domain-containing protein [Rubrivivax sp.]|nr:substrate-binding domain-containing protein [Rubrivivax sp.]
MTTLHLLCAGAAQGLVKALQERFLAETGAQLQARFGAVGAMKEALFAGAPCDVMIVTAAMVDALCAEGRLRAGTRVALGQVFTGVAVQAGTPHPDVGTPAALKAALLRSSDIYFPDAVRATAGIHFARVMAELGIRETLEPRFRTYPAGAIAMQALATATGAAPIGCTQVTEIKYTPGVELVGLLPPEFALATTYTAAVSAQAAEPALAAAFIGLLVGADTRALRAAGGFEF